MVVYHAADLLWGSRIKAEGEAAGVACRPVRSVEMLEARLADSPVRGLVVDLDAPEVALELIRRVKGEGGGEAGGLGVRVAAFGPHVATEALAAAREAGADVVMTRGAFAGRVGEVLRELEGGGEGAP